MLILHSIIFFFLTLRTSQNNPDRIYIYLHDHKIIYDAKICLISIPIATELVQFPAGTVTLGKIIIYYWMDGWMDGYLKYISIPNTYTIETAPE